MAREVRARPGSPIWRELVETKCIAKRQFMTREAAELFLEWRAKRYPGERFVYECPFCSLFHTTSAPP
jgi:hypothetical protein